MDDRSRKTQPSFWSSNQCSLRAMLTLLPGIRRRKIDGNSLLLLLDGFVILCTMWRRHKAFSSLPRLGSAQKRRRRREEEKNPRGKSICITHLKRENEKKGRRKNRHTHIKDQGLSSFANSRRIHDHYDMSHPLVTSSSPLLLLLLSFFLLLF